MGCFERTAGILSIVKQITSPGGMHETSAWTWCTGKTQRNRVEREVGGGIGMGNTEKKKKERNVTVLVPSPSRIILSKI